MVFLPHPVGYRDRREKNHKRHSTILDIVCPYFKKEYFSFSCVIVILFPFSDATYAAFSPSIPGRKRARPQKDPRRQRNISRAGTSRYCAILAENLFFAKTVIVYGTVCPYLQKSMSLIKAKGMEPLGQTFKAKETIGLCIKQKNGSINVACPYKNPFFQPIVTDVPF